MYTGFQHLHSTLAYLALALLLVAVVFSLLNYNKNAPFAGLNKKIVLYAMIGVHIQLLIGLTLYFISPMGFSNFSGEAMKEAASRLYIIEHPFTMILATVLITIGYSGSKRKTDDRQKHKRILIFFGIGLLLILSRIPWSAWLG